jgi:hypothetical protein
MRIFSGPPVLSAAPGDSKKPVLDPVSLLDWGLKNMTPVGAIGATIWIVSGFAKAYLDKSWAECWSTAGYMGLVMLIAGAAFRSKRAADVAVTNAASSEVGRAAIMNAITPEHVLVEPSSPDPAIQREIASQVRASGNDIPKPGRS